MGCVDDWTWWSWSLSYPALMIICSADFFKFLVAKISSAVLPAHCDRQVTLMMAVMSLWSIAYNLQQRGGGRKQWVGNESSLSGVPLLYCRRRMLYYRTRTAYGCIWDLGWPTNITHSSSCLLPSFHCFSLCFLSEQSLVPVQQQLRSYNEIPAWESYGNGYVASLFQSQKLVCTNF